jgi:4-carboxymuconolactone decarboxylase
MASAEAGVVRGEVNANLLLGVWQLGRGGAMRSNYTHSEIDVRRANLSELGLFVSGSEGSPDGGVISHSETSGDPPLTRSALKLGFEDCGHRWPRMWHTSGPFSMFLYSPELAGRVAHLGALVRFEGSLDMRVRVLAAMTAAREFDAVYVWGAQTGSARRQGVPEETITAIREKHTRGVPPEDAQIIDFTMQLIRKHRVDEATFKAVQTRFGNDQLLQLTGAIGYYVMLAMTVNACELEAAPGAEVLQP